MAATLHRLRMIVPAGKATPSPPVGPVLGQKGIKAIDFCKQFNDRTKPFLPSTPIPVHLHIHADKTYNFTTKTPSTSYFLLKAAGLEKGAARPGNEVVGQVSLKHVYEIAKIKKMDGTLRDMELQSICKHVIGQASSMGIQIIP
jgi:large subunit ribosomal protein L11